MSTELTDQAREVAEAMAPVLARDYRKECWIAAYATAGGPPEIAAILADKALQQFDQKFPS